MLNVENESFHYEFIINSKNIVEFINQIDGKGKVEGFVNKNFPKNKNFLEMVKKSAFSSQANEIVDDDFKLDKNQTISIIPPIGGG